MLSEAECYTLLGLNEMCTREEVSTAFRSKARFYHPDKAKKKQCYEFSDLVYARDVLLANCVKEVCVEQEYDGYEVILKYGKVGLIKMLERAPTFHSCALRMAYALRNPKWIRRVRDAINVYYQGAIRVVHLDGTLTDALNGHVRIWSNGGKKMFVPLWYPSLFFEEECLLFVVRLVHAEEGIVYNVEVCDETHDVRLTAGGTPRGKATRLVGVGLYKPCDDDIYNTDARADIEYVV
jgi:hypothetical protein